VLRRWIGPLVTFVILGGVAVILLANLETGRHVSLRPTSPEVPPPASRPNVAGFREYPIGEPWEKNQMSIAAVWLPSVEVEGMNVRTGSDIIHLEADIHATEGNANGFAKGEFVPYLKITYRIEPAAGGRPLEGDLIPMVARDGLHYGASLSLPSAGKYTLSYQIQPPSSGGLGRHHDPITGVAPWWSPFQVQFEWDYPGPPGHSPDEEAGTGKSS
jgi:uncharacterized protein involved in high-affinity Fe2+ transport